jgi:lycopene beta-cyclase
MSAEDERPVFDVAIVGAGVSGLCLARALVEAPETRGLAILLVDGARDDDALRTLSFWACGETPLDGLVRHTWHALDVTRADGVVTRAPLREHRYRTLFLADLRRDVTARLAASPRCRVIDGRVGALRETTDHVEVDVAGDAWRARRVFDSRFRRGALAVDTRRWHLLWQHFQGWIVRVSRDVFDPAAVRLFDFRTRLPSGTAFFYTLPFSAREALVEFVSLSPTDAASALHDHLTRVVGLREGEWSVVAHEAGVSPMTEQPFEGGVSPRIRAIGIAAGRLKPSTGYALTRILDDSARVAASLARRDARIAAPPARPGYRFLDGVLLELWSSRPARIPAVFGAMFARNPADRVLRFLDERAAPGDLVAFMATLPIGPLVWAALRWLWRRLRARG